MTIEQIFAVAAAGIAALCLLFFIFKFLVQWIVKGIKLFFYKIKLLAKMLHSLVLGLHFLLAVAAGVYFFGLIPVAIPPVVFAVPVALGALIVFRCFISRKNQGRRYFLGCMAILQTVFCLVPLLGALL